MRSTRRLFTVVTSIVALGGVGMTRPAHAGACQIAGSTSFGYSGGAQFCEVTSSGLYDITALGANGGEGDVGSNGGQGAEAGGLFQLSAGLMIGFIVGGGGHGGVDIGAAGGGGGTFVVAQSGNSVIPIVVAGGGGGGNGNDFTPGGNGLATLAGGAGLGSGGLGGIGGAGGGTSGGYGGAGGGGFFTAGANSVANTGGTDALDGGAGGYGAENSGDGGFGGGGGAGLFGGGGGGGASGGGGGNEDAGGGGGGGSYVYPGAADAVLIAGDNTGGDSANGGLTFTLEPATMLTSASMLEANVVRFSAVRPVPEPLSLSLLGTGLVGLALVRRRRG